MEWNKDSIKLKLEKSIDFLHSELSSIRAGMASTGLIANIPLEIYGSSMKLNQVALVTVMSNSELAAKPFDMQNLSAIEKAIQIANLGFSCSSNGSEVIVKLPKLTKEVRLNLVKNVKSIGEDAKVHIRQIRKKEFDTIKNLLESKEISEDSFRRYSDQIENILSEYIDKINKEIEKKTKSIISID